MSISKEHQYINEKYDIREDYDARVYMDIDLDTSKEVTVIAGGSGSGKTTLLRKWFEIENPTFNVDDSKSIFEHLVDGEDYEETSKLLFDVGLSSVPVWKNKYSQISNGEKLRFEVAYKLKYSDDIFYVDEFTSMLDRQTAQNMSINLNKLLRQYNKRIVIATAHFDVLDWIEVDQVVDTNLKKSIALQNPKLVTLTKFRYEVFQEICGEYLSTITI